MHFFKGWLEKGSIFTTSLAFVFSIPIFAVIWLALTPSEAIWAHLMATVLPGYVLNTLLLMLGVGLGVLVLGISTAWLVTTYRFPAHRFFAGALFLPLAMPAYIMATIYLELLEFSGPVQTFLRSLFGWQSLRDYWFPSIATLGGAIIVLSFALYPYVYLLARASFLEISPRTIEASRLLGKGAWESFFRITLPLARPAIVVGLILAWMETLGDFGTVQIFAVNTFTRGIYSVWLGMYNPSGAAQLACTVLIFVLILIVLERLSRGQQRYYQGEACTQCKAKIPLPAPWALLACLTCSVPIFFGFLLPVSVLLVWVFETYETTWTARFLSDASNSLMLASISAGLSVVLALLVAYGGRLRPTGLVRVTTRIAMMGYAIPGPIIALGVLIPFAAFDNAVDGFMRKAYGISSGLLLSGTTVAVIFAYLVRFQALSFGTIEAGLTKITQEVEEASRTLGHGALATLQRIHVPLLRKSILTATILVFVDVMKELPATLMLQPFNFSTLATRVYEYASDERFHESALWALAITSAGILPVILLSQSLQSWRNSD